ncbi:ATP-grasp domain-containing protein [Aquipuribacter sp. MA13-6]|uniref:ATP-grasp domain-containing protein n=1 Tax=unclassified Aquipuribacter TaxID=2635084 RepID=UPI003EEB027D
MTPTGRAAVHAIHENADWWPPFAAAFEAEGVPVRQWLLTGEEPLDLTGEPPEGVFWSRMSASAHTRGHSRSIAHTRAVLRWLEGHGRRVVNGSAVLELEVSKVAQDAALRAAGIDTPLTVVAFDREQVVAGARSLFGRGTDSVVTKHNQGGKGLGVRRFDDLASLTAHVSSPQWVEPVDGVALVQEYVAPAEPFVTRAEFVGGRFLYAVAASTAQGFELCPADACGVDGAPLFRLREGHVPPLLERYEAFLAATGIEIAGIEYIETTDGRVVTYDVNTNTNYNPDVEAVAPVSGPREIARYLASQTVA